MRFLMDFDGKRYLLSNEDLKVGDKTFPLTEGQTINGEYYVRNIRNPKTDRFFDACTSFPHDPHIIENLHHNDDFKPYEVRTNKGYGPREKYFKIVDSIEIS